jgi:cytochrome d ubiquinol oxidase subunit I
MTDAMVAARWQFAFTIMFHYLFPVLTMGLGVIIAVLKTLEMRTGRREYGHAARFWARIFAITFATGVVTGIPMEFQFGTNWARFSHFAGPVVGQTLFMEGVFAFFAESSFLGLFLFGEQRVSRGLHWLSSVMVALGAVVSGFFIVATNAWMQHPVGYGIVDGRAELTSLWALLSNPYARWQYPHVISGSMIVASMVVAGIGAYYLLAKRDEASGRVFVRVGVVAGLVFSLITLFPTGSFHGENIARFQPAKMAAMEGLFESQEGAGMAIIGMPDTVQKKLIDPIVVPGVLSYLIYGDFRARVVGLNDIPAVPHHGRARHDLHRDPRAVGVPPVARDAVHVARHVVGADARDAVPLHRESCGMGRRRGGPPALGRVGSRTHGRGFIAQRQRRDDLLHALRLPGPLRAGGAALPAAVPADREPRSRKPGYAS